MSNLPLTRDDFAAARLRTAGHLHHTPLFSTTLLGERIGAELYLKCENLQKTGSFKPRGGLNKLLQLDDESRSRGVVTVSAGNHAQALAWAARVANTPCVVVMPADASPTKTAASREYGAEVILHGTVFEAFEKAHELEQERDLTYVHPFDDLQMIAGHGSAGLEIIDQLDPVTVIVVPIGGGGHIAGIAGAVKLERPDVRIYGVEPEGACAMRKSLDAGQAVQLDAVNTIADGLAAPMAGKLNYEFVKEYVEDVVLVSDEEIIDAMGAILTRTKLVAEPAGAAALAALLAGRIPVHESDQVVASLSGGNLGLDQFAELAEHWEEGGRG